MTASFARKLIAWQKRHGRHDLPWQNTRDPYAIWVSEIMLQQTQVAAVVPYYRRFLKSFPDIGALAAAQQDEVLAHWSGLGYYSRGRNLYEAARIVAREHAGRFPDDFEQILQLPGIGRSTAAAICVFAFGARRAILDGNVKRVLARYFGIEGYPGEKRVETIYGAGRTRCCPGAISKPIPRESWISAPACARGGSRSAKPARWARIASRAGAD